MKIRFLIPTATLLTLTFAQAQTTPPAPGSTSCTEVPSYADLKAALVAAQAQKNGGLAFHMWGTVVNRDGIVCAVAFTGTTRSDQWPGSRVISAQKANTANAFSLPGFALSTANLYSAVQPGGTLFGLQDSNPVDVSVAFGGKAEDFGTATDPMVGKRIGGVNVFGGGLALYANGKIVGGLGVSGDTSCTDHIIAWRVRDTLKLDFVPAGVAGASKDNIIHDLFTSGGQTQSASGYGHPTCDSTATSTANSLPGIAPIGPNPGQ